MTKTDTKKHAGERTPSIQISAVAGSPHEIETDLLVTSAFSDGTLPAATRAIDEASKGWLKKLIDRGDLPEKPGSTLLLHDVPGTAAKRVLLASLGNKSKFGEKALRDTIAGISKALRESAAAEAVITPEDELTGRDLTWRVQQAALMFTDGAYRYDGRGKPEPKDARKGVEKIRLLVPGKVDAKVERAIEQGQAIAAGMALTKDLGNLPGNVCNPTYLAEKAVALGKELGFGVEVLERSDMEKLGMGSALSVGQASAQPCKFIVMNYKGAGDARPIVLVGKGVTFDTGGVSLKPGADMDEMKFDMCGAAAVFGALKAVGSLKLPLNVIGIVPAVENMPGSKASRPGDVVKSMSGLTIEILNTDAEGRLILCDALTYAERFEPACVVDIATLTGACVIALGNLTSGLFANDDKLAQELLACGTETGDRAWQLPLYEEYLDQLKSNFADLSNLGGRAAGSVTAACFLAKFTQGYKWAHLDIAGTASRSGPEKGATGRPVPLLTEFLIRRAENRQALAAE